MSLFNSFTNWGANEDLTLIEIKIKTNKFYNQIGIDKFFP